MKLKKAFIIHSFHGTASPDATKRLSLWQSEKYAFEKCLYQDDSILDMGCGTGRTTFALYKKGFQNITGINLTPDMLTEAEKIAMNITWTSPLSLAMQRTSLFNDSSFKKAIFAFNGLMQIHQQKTAHWL
ncbi:class I SAM-dependent methyltransferase [Peribacillus simplex]|uniref:class I SAM-dependent methyltransferase n=1 Tax=Peribacillus simplex TaxID=1478 RepID=UPI003CEC4A45